MKIIKYLFQFSPRLALAPLSRINTDHGVLQREDELHHLNPLPGVENNGAKILLNFLNNRGDFLQPFHNIKPECDPCQRFHFLCPPEATGFPRWLLIRTKPMKRNRWLMAERNDDRYCPFGFCSLGRLLTFYLASIWTRNVSTSRQLVINFCWTLTSERFFSV